MYGYLSKQVKKECKFIHFHGGVGVIVSVFLKRRLKKMGVNTRWSG